MIRIVTDLHPLESFDADAELVQRNKQSIGIDLERSGGPRCPGATRWIRPTSSSPICLFAELEALGLDPASLAARNPALVYVRGSGFRTQRARPRSTGPRRARSGTHRRDADPSPARRTPVYAGAGQMYTSVMLALGTMVALHHRGETGEGQVVDASLFSGNMYGAALQLDAYLAMRDDRLSVPVARLDAGNPMSGAGLAYPTSDGRWITLTMPDSDRWWPTFSKVMGLDENDPRFDSHDKRCGEGRVEMMAILDERFSKQSGAYWRQRFDEERLSADVMERYEYVAELAQAAMNRYILDLEHPSYGTYQSLGFPIHMGDTPARLCTDGARCRSALRRDPRRGARPSRFRDRGTGTGRCHRHRPQPVAPLRGVRERRETGAAPPRPVPGNSPRVGRRLPHLATRPPGGGLWMGCGCWISPCGSRVRCVPSTWRTSAPR